MEADVAAARKAGRDRRRRRKARAKAKAMAHFRQRSKPQQSREKSRSPSRSRSPGTKKKSRKRSRELRLMHELLRKYQSDLDFCAIGKCLNVLEGVPSEELLGEDLDLAAQAYIAVGELNHALEVLAVLILNFPQYEKLDRAILRAACLLKLKGRLEESESYFTYLQEIPPEPLPEHAILYQLAFVAKMKGKEKSTGSREGQRESKVKGSTSIAGAAFREARVRERQYEAMEVARRKRREVEEQDEGRKKQGEQRKQKASLPTAATRKSISTLLLSPSSQRQVNQCENNSHHAVPAAILSPKLSMLSPKETRATQKPKRRPAPMAVTMRDYTFWEARAVEMFRAGFFVCAAELFQQGIRLVVSSNSTSSASKESDNQHEGAALRCRVIPMLAGLCVCFLRTGERDEARDAASSALVSAEIIKALGNAELARRCQERVAHVFGVYEQRSREQTNEWEWTFPTHGANLYSHVGRVDGTRLIAIDSVIDVLLELLRLADCACLGTALHRGQREREQQRDNDEKESSSSIDQQKVNFTEVHSLLHMTKGHFQRSVAAQQLQEAERKRQRRKKARALALRCARSMAERSTRYVFETWVKTARLSCALAQFGGRLNRKLSRNVFQSWNSFRCGARCARTLMLIRRSRLRKAISLMKLRSFLLPPLNAALNRLQERKFFRALREHRDSENARRLGATMTIQRAAWRWAFNGALVRAACRLRKRGPSCRPRPRCLWEECRAFCLAAIAGDDVAAAVIANASEGGILNNELRGTIDEVTKRVEIENESMQTVIQRAIARADAHARVDALAGAFLSGTGTDADSFAPMPGALRPSAKVGGILFLANAHKEQCCRLRAIPFQALYRGFSFRLLRSRAAAMIARVWRSFVRRRMLRWAVLEACVVGYEKILKRNVSQSS